MDYDLLRENQCTQVCEGCMETLAALKEQRQPKYKKYKWGVGSSWPSRKRSWRQEIVDVGSGSACGEYSHCWSCRSFSFTFGTSKEEDLEAWFRSHHRNGE